MKEKVEKIFAIVKDLLRTNIGIALIIAVSWQGILTILGALLDSASARMFQNELTATPFTILGHTIMWDAVWYMSIINGEYFNLERPAAAFYPLFPLLVYTLHVFTFGVISYVTSGLIINTVALAVAIYALKGISEQFLNKSNSWLPVILFLAAPTAIFMHFFYTEALFCALGFLAYYLALRRRWLLMGITLAALTASRFPSVLFIGLCALEFLRAYNWSFKKILNRDILAFLLAPIGFLMYGIFLLISRGNFFAMFNAYSLSDEWSYLSFNPNIFQTYTSSIQHLINVFTSVAPFDDGQFINFLWPLIGLGILYAASVYTLIRLPRSTGIPLGIFGIVAGIFYSLNTSLISVNRYLLSCLVIYIALAHLSQTLKFFRYILIGIVYCGILLQAFLLILFVNGYFAG